MYSAESVISCDYGFMIRIFAQNSFQSISVIFCLLVPDVLKIAFSTMDRMDSFFFTIE